MLQIPPNLFKGLDDIHFSYREVDGYQKDFIFIISEREPGKSTMTWLFKAYLAFYVLGTPVIAIRRQVVDITDVYVDDISKLLNKFLVNPIKFKYKKTFDEGIVDIYIGEKLFIRLIALSIQVNRYKSLIVPNVRCIIFDEFIVNSSFGEKYLKREAYRFKELYNTFQRETKRLKCYFLGNPYSLYNPYFMDLGVDTKKLKRGTIQTGVNWIVQCYAMKPELRKKIMENNPLYQFDDAYTRYAFNGENVNDAHIRLGEKQDGYRLRFVFFIENKYLGVYSNYTGDSTQPRYFVDEVSEVSARRTTYCFDFESIVNNNILISNDEKLKFIHFKTAMRKGEVAFKTIEYYYLSREIYENI